MDGRKRRDRTVEIQGAQAIRPGDLSAAAEERQQHQGRLCRDQVQGRGWIAGPRRRRRLAGEGREQLLRDPGQCLEDNVVLYKTVDGVRSPLDIVGRKGGYGIDVKVPADTWHSLRIDFSGSRFRVSFNGKQLFEVEDSTFADAGKVGLWTKADSVTLFDQVTYGEAK